MTRDELVKLGAKTATERLKKALAEAMPDIRWQVSARAAEALANATRTR